MKGSGKVSEWSCDTWDESWGKQVRERKEESSKENMRCKDTLAWASEQHVRTAIANVKDGQRNKAESVGKMQITVPCILH